MTQVSFEKIEDIPDLIPKSLLLPFYREDLRVPRETEHTGITTSPIEVAYCIYEHGIGGFGAEKHLLETEERLGSSAEEFLTDYWGNHLGRAVVRAMLDPDRRSPIFMPNVYKHELERGTARFPAPDEVLFFEGFVKNFGVLDRSSRLVA